MGADKRDDSVRKLVCVECMAPALELVNLSDEKDRIYTHLESDRDFDHAVNELWVDENFTCDFCGETPAELSWVYPVTTEGRAPVVMPHASRAHIDLARSINGEAWGACEGCAEQVEAGKRTALALRYKKVAAKQGHPVDTLAMECVWILLDQFFSSRSGERKKFGGGSSGL